jgi:hypothetical protein
MTERYGSGDGSEGGRRPSGRGAVTERLARQDQDTREIDLTDQADREASGAFEPAEPVAPAAEPPDEADRAGSSIFDVGERARQEDLNPTGYEPPVADTDDPDGPRGEVAVTEPGEARAEPSEPEPSEPEPPEPPEPEAEAVAAEPEPEAAPATAEADAAEAEAEVEAAPASAEVPEDLLGSLDTAGIRNRFLDIQAGFIDEPRQAVEEAGRFVDDLLRQVTDALQQQRGQLAGVTPEASTEDLRLALRAYRQFVDRLLGLSG